MKNFIQQLKKWWNNLIQKFKGKPEPSQNKKPEKSKETDNQENYLTKDNKASSPEKKEYLKGYNQRDYVKAKKHDYYLNNKARLYERKKLKRQRDRLEREQFKEEEIKS